MYCKYLNLRNNEELAQITMRKRNSTLNQSTPNCPGLAYLYCRDGTTLQTNQNFLIDQIILISNIRGRYLRFGE